MSTLQGFSVDEVIKRGSIKDADVAKLRAAFFEDGLISQPEADMMFALNNGCGVQDPSWPVFFKEAIVDYVVSQAEPEGYVTIENAGWLMERAGASGKVVTKNELELLVEVLEEARWSPPSLIKFTIEQVRNAVLDDDSPLRGAKNGNPGTILESEVELIRRMMYAFGGDGNIAVTQFEAEVLFDINDVISEREVNPAWTELFVKAVANSVMASSGYRVPSREQALHAEGWLAERGELGLGKMVSDVAGAETSKLSLISEMFSKGLDGVFKSYKEQSREEKALARLEVQRLEIVTNEQITDDEGQWLAQRLGRDGKITESETALLSYLVTYSGTLHPALRDVVSRFGAAA